MDKAVVTSAAGKNLPGGFFIRVLTVVTVVGWILRLVAAWEMAGESICKKTRRCRGISLRYFVRLAR